MCLTLSLSSLPNLAIRRPPRSSPSSPSTTTRSDGAWPRADRLKASSYKNAQAWLNKAKAESQTPGTGTSLDGISVGTNGNGNGSGQSNRMNGRPSTLADFVAASRTASGSLGMSSSFSQPGISGPSTSIANYPSSTTADLPFSASANRQRSSVTGSNSDRDQTPDPSAPNSTRKRPRFTRSTAGCLGCRKQKVKCDESRPTCLKCIAAERECVWPPEGGRKRRKRGTVGAGKDKDKQGSEAVSVKGEHVEPGDEDVAPQSSKQGSDKRTVPYIKMRTSMTRQTSGIGGSSGSGGSSEEDDDDGEDEDPSEPNQQPNDTGGLFTGGTYGKDHPSAGLNALQNPAGHAQSLMGMPDTPGFNLDTANWDFTSHLLGPGHNENSDTGTNIGRNDGVQTVLNMGLNSGVSANNSGHAMSSHDTSNSYMRAHSQSISMGHGQPLGADEMLASHSMPTPSSVHSQSGMNMEGHGGASGGMSMNTATSQLSFLNDSPSGMLASPVATTNVHSLIHPANSGVTNPHTYDNNIGSSSNHNNSINTSIGNSMSSVRQGTVSPSQLLLPRSSMTGGNSTPGLGGVSNSMTMTAPATTLSPPQLIDLSKSSLLAKRKDKARFGSNSGTMQDPNANGGTGGAMVDVTPGQLRVAMVEMILQAFSFDEGLFEFGPSHRTRNILNTLSTPINTDFLSLAFPSPAARLLFHHYCNVTSRLLITMGNVGPNPLLALCTPLKLLDTASAWAGAIRMSILSISATHFAHETETSVGREMLGIEWDAKRARLKELSRKFKKAALCNVYLGTGGDDPHQIDSILAACTLLCIRDVIDADETWQDNLEFALHMISKRGGPLAMLKAADTSFTRRYLLENLAVHDVFGCFITGKEPALLGNYDPWWFDSVDSSTTRWEWESVEQTFGISRTVVDLLARIAALDSRKRRLEINLARNPEEMNDVGQYIYRECQNLLFELDILGNSLSALPQHVRVTCGDYIYKYTAAVYVLADILEEPPSTPRIIRDVASILELCSEASAMRMSVMLIWPLLIAGTFCLPDIRPKVEELFDVFEPYYAEDLPAARLLLREQWKGMDEGKGKRSWREVMKAANKFVLLI